MPHQANSANYKINAHTHLKKVLSELEKENKLTKTNAQHVYNLVWQAGEIWDPFWKSWEMS